MRRAGPVILVVLLVLIAGCSRPVVTTPSTQVPGTGQTPAPMISGANPLVTNQSATPRGGSQAATGTTFAPGPRMPAGVTMNVSSGSAPAGLGMTNISGPVPATSGQTAVIPGGSPFTQPQQVSIPIPSPPSLTGTFSPPVVPTPGTPVPTPSPGLPQPSPPTFLPTTLVTPPLPTTSPSVSIPTPRPT
jgi:hypothetical protein